MSKKPTKKRRLTRNVKVPGQESAAERQTRTAVQFIMGNPHYQTILKTIRQGVPNSKIAEHFISRGVFDGVNQKTAVGYLQYFRRAQSGLCKPQPPGEDDPAGYDHLFDGNSIIIDEETELLKLISLQKARIGLGFYNEREIQVLITSNRKEIEELRNLLMDLAKLRGLVGSHMDINLHGYSDTVKDDLKGIKQDEGQRNVIATLVTDLAKVSDRGT